MSDIYNPNLVTVDDDGTIIGTQPSINFISGTGATVNAVNNTVDKRIDVTISATGTGGTVTSVNVSGSTTGLTTSGGPITTSGVITLAGTLVPANGGTGTSTVFTPGSVIFAGTSGIYTQDNANFFWDDTNNWLGVGTNIPARRAEFLDNTAAQLRLTETAATNYIDFRATSTGMTITNPNTGTITWSWSGANLAVIMAPSQLTHRTNSITAARGIQGFQYDNSTASLGAKLALARSRSGTIGTQGLITNGDTEGIIVFQGSDGSAFVTGASIEATVSGAPNSGIIPTALNISTANISGVLTCALTISSTQIIALPTYTSNGFLKTGGGVGTLSVDTGNYQPLDAALTSIAGVSWVQGDIGYWSGVDTTAALAKDTNATRYISNQGTSNNPSWNQVNLANGVTGQLPLANGGTNANLTASNGGIFYSTASAGAILSGTATASKVLLSGATAAPTWSTWTMPTTATNNKILVGDGTNFVLSTATFPVTIGAAGTFIRSDGTNWVASTSTIPDTFAAGSAVVANSANVLTALNSTSGTKELLNTAGVISWNTVTGTGSSVLATSPTFVTPTLGVATMSSTSNVSTSVASGESNFKIINSSAGSSQFATLYLQPTSTAGDNTQLFRAGGTNGNATLLNSGSGNFSITVNSVTPLIVYPTEVVVNENSSSTVNLRAESDNNSTMFLVDSAADRVNAIGSPTAMGIFRAGQSSASSASAPTTIATSNYIQVGGLEFNTNSYRLIGFGYNQGGSEVAPAFVGYIETSNAGSTKGALIFLTRDSTTGTVVPTERVRITSAGRVGIASNAPAAALEISVANGVTDGLFITRAPGDTAEGLALYYLNSGNTISYLDSRYDSAGSKILIRNRANGATPVNTLTLMGSGFVGLNLAAGITPTNDLSFDGTALRTIWMERNTTAATAGNTLVVQAAGATSATTDKAGGTLYLSPGVSTGQGTALVSIAGYTFPTASGTGDNTQVTRATYGLTKVLTNNTATSLVNVANASNTATGGRIFYTIWSSNGTDFGVNSGVATFAAANRANASITAAIVNTSGDNASTLTTLGSSVSVAWTITAANPAVIKIQANQTSAAAGYPRITYTLINDGDQSMTPQ